MILHSKCGCSGPLLQFKNKILLLSHLGMYVSNKQRNLFAPCGRNTVVCVALQCATRVASTRTPPRARCVRPEATRSRATATRRATCARTSEATRRRCSPAPTTGGSAVRTRGHSHVVTITWSQSRGHSSRGRGSRGYVPQYT